MKILSIFLRNKLFKAKPSPSQSPSKENTFTVDNPLSPIIEIEEPSISESESISDSPSEPWIGPSIVPSWSPTIAPSYSYNEPIKKSLLLKKPKRIEDNFKPSQSTRDYKRVIDKEEE